MLLLRDSFAGELNEIPRDKIASEQAIGSLMPPTAQALSPEDLADLLSYLFRLGERSGDR